MISISNNENNKGNHFISKNLIYIYLIIIQINFISSYYIIPFKYYKISLSDSYKIHNNITQDEIFLNFTNNIILYSMLQKNNSYTVQAFLKSKDICSSFLGNSCTSEFNSIINLSNVHINQNISKILDKIYVNGESILENKKCFSVLLGFGFQNTILSKNCISLIEQIKINDNNANTYTWSLNYFNSTLKNNYNYDGEIIIGIEPHEYKPHIFNLSNYRTIYTYEDFDNYYLNKNSEYCIKFDSIYFYNNSNKSSDNIVKCVGPSSMDGYFRFNSGMIQSSYEYFYLIKKNFFDNFINSKICKEIIFSKSYHTFVCDKKKLDVEKFYKMFPTLYFKNIDLNYIFELNANDLFKEENNNIYFMILCNELVSLKWIFGEIFLKKYHFTFNQNDKLIGFYNINKKNDEKNIFEKDKENISEIGKTFIGFILLFISIFILLVEIILAGIWIRKNKFWNNRRKRANELNDDNYDYIMDNPKNI